MKPLFILSLLLLLASPCLAGSCPDIQESANGAIQARNNRVTQSHNTTMPDPEEQRESLSECLKSIQALGESFTLGITLPGIDEVVSGMCGAVDSFISQKIDEVQNQVLNEINNIGGGNLLKVYGTGSDRIVQLKGKIK